MKKSIAFSFVVFALLVSCRKKNEPVTSNVTSVYFPCNGCVEADDSTTVITQTETSVPTPTTSSTDVDAIFLITSYTSVAAAQTTVVNSGTVNFEDYPPLMNSIYGVPLKRVYLNGDSLVPGSFFGEYWSLPSTNFNGNHWKVEGSKGIPSFTIASPPEPVCSGLQLIPSSISLSNGVTISLTLSNAKSAMLELSKVNGNFTQRKQYLLFNGINNIQILPQDLGGFIATTGAQISVGYDNSTNHLVGEKVFSFQHHSTFVKEIELIN